MQMLTQDELVQRIERPDVAVVATPRRRRWVTIGVLVGAAVASGWLAFRPADTTVPTSDTTVAPSGTTVADSAPPPSVVPAVVSGSGLDGYIQTTFPALAAPDWVGVQDVAVAPDGTVWAVNLFWALVRFDGDTWTTYPAEDGLPPGLVRSVDVAPDGTVWVAADGGLARLDGETWTTVLMSDGGPLPTSFGPDGSIVTGTADRVVRFDGEAWTTLTNVGTIPEWESVSAVAIAPDGAMWVGTRWGYVGTGYLLRFDGSVWTTWSVNGLLGHEGRPARVSALTVASDGAVWALLDDWTVARFADGTWTVSPLPTTVQHTVLRAASMTLGPDGTIWIGIGGDRDALVFSFDGSSWTTDRLGSYGSPLTIEPDGTLWVGADASLIRLTPPED